MENSSKFFANKDCSYYPCHRIEGDMNCLFCFCPLYNLACPGNYTIIDKGDRKIKSCKNCNFPHVPGNYDKVMEYLRARGREMAGDSNRDDK